MNLYLMQHGKATPKTIDPLRPLTSSGVRAIIHVTQKANQREWALPLISHIYHSGKLRALQTAEVFVEHYHGSPTISRGEGLQPNDGPSTWLQKLAESSLSVIMLIGHLPHLQKLAAILLGKDLIEFRNAGLVYLERNAKGEWKKIDVVLPPDE